MIPEALGGILVGGGLIQFGLVTAANFRRLSGQNRQADLSLELLKTELEMMRDLRRQKAESGSPWNGWRKFLVARKVMECDDICSFHLSPHDKKALPGFLPGQYLTFNLDIPGQTKPVVRCYSLSDSPRPENYRVTIKRIPPRDKDKPPGLASTFFYDQVNEGDMTLQSYGVDPAAQTDSLVDQRLINKAAIVAAHGKFPGKARNAIADHAAPQRLQCSCEAGIAAPQQAQLRLRCRQPCHPWQ